jgi:asparagine N-glycosylation enzyme membrane subunit Stt3
MVDSKELKEYSEQVFDFFKDKKVQNIIVIVLLIATIFLGAYIRLQALPNLIDPTTGDYTPLALDPYYFLRVSETLLETGGALPEIDNFRSPHLGVLWTSEVLPQSTVLIYKVMKIFNSDTTIGFAAVLNPVILFILGLIAFAFLCYVLTKNKWATLIGTFILTIIPPYLYRTLAGFSDHEAIGMLGFFLALLFFAFGMLFVEKKKSNYSGAAGIGLITGLMAMFAIASWGGGAKFLFMILPLAFLVNWFINKKHGWNSILFYGMFIFGVSIFAPLFGFSSINTIKAYMLNSAGILTLFAFGYSLVELILLRSKILNKKLSKYSKLISFGTVILLGAIFYEIISGNIFMMIKQLLNAIINPFGTERVALTVAENKQPYLNDWISQISKIVFYTFLGGCFIVGGKLAKGIKKRKLKPLFVTTFALFVVGILFSRISASSILNGENFISKALFFISFLAFAISTIYIYRKSDWEIDTKWILIVAWMIPMLLAVRSAIRVFFAIVPFVSFMIPLTLFEIGKWAKKTKDSLAKLIGFILLIVLIIGLISTSMIFYKTVKTQATHQSPSYNSDWQKAMSWVRNNTAEGSVFLHWWDYGYWVQTGGNRPTFSDGGHSQTAFGDHLMGRYVLTTPKPETAKSFMKSHNISYLLIDPTDIGKYPAYSSIGDDKEISDRASWIVTLTSNPSEIKETRNGTSRIYRGGTVLDGDIMYKNNSTNIFLPKSKAGIGAIILTKTETGYSQPIGAYVFNGNQYDLPIRYLFTSGELIDFGSGINATVYVYANVYSSPSGTQFDLNGAVMYLSEKTMDSLVAKLYLMNDPLNEYSELELVHSQENYPFKFYYQGFRGPISIWKVNEMSDILAREEFTTLNGEYGEFDDLQFIK